MSCGCNRREPPPRACLDKKNHIHEHHPVGVHFPDRVELRCLVCNVLIAERPLGAPMTGTKYRAYTDDGVVHNVCLFCGTDSTGWEPDHTDDCPVTKEN